MDRLEEAMQAAVQYQDGLQVRLAGSPGGRDQVISDAYKFTHQYVPQSCKCDAVNSPASIHALPF